MTIMQRIEQLNAERGWTLYQLSNRANLSVYTLYSCKNKNREPSNETLKKICDAFGITIFQFYHDMHDVPNLTDRQRSILQKCTLLTDKELELIEQMQDALLSARTPTDTNKS